MPSSKGISNLLPTLCVLVLISCLSLALQTQSHCDPNLEPVDGPTGYQLRGDRCEGTYVREVCATLIIVSFTEYFEEYSLDAGEDLKIQWIAPDEEAVRLRAIGLRPRLYYQMDTRRPPGHSSYRWPLEILHELNLSQGDIGVVGSIESTIEEVDRQVFIPLRISQRSGEVDTSGYTLILLPGVELNEVYVSLATVGPNGRPERFLRDGERLGYGYYPAERPVEIPINDLKTPGMYFLEIGVTLRSGGTEAIPVWFRHRG